MAPSLSGNCRRGVTHSYGTTLDWRFSVLGGTKTCGSWSINSFGSTLGLQDCLVQELTPSPINLRSRVHSYGGGVVAIASKEDQIVIAWIDDSDRSLWTQSFQVSSNSSSEQSMWIEPLQS